MITHVVLVAARSQGRFDRAQERRHAHGALDERDVSDFTECIERVGVGGCVCAAAGQNDERNIGPCGLLRERLGETPQGFRRQRLAREKGEASTVEHLTAHLFNRAAHLWGQTGFAEEARSEPGVSAAWRENQYPFIPIVWRFRHRHRTLESTCLPLRCMWERRRALHETLSKAGRRESLSM